VLQKLADQPTDDQVGLEQVAEELKQENQRLRERLELMESSNSGVAGPRGETNSLQLQLYFKLMIGND
jgi:hypothetical protein